MQATIAFMTEIMTEGFTLKSQRKRHKESWKQFKKFMQILQYFSWQNFSNSYNYYAKSYIIFVPVILLEVSFIAILTSSECYIWSVNGTDFTAKHLK